MGTETSLTQPLIDEFVAAAHGDFDKVRLLLSEHPGLLNENASWQERAVEAASQTGRVDIVEYLLAAGAPMDICTAVMLGDLSAVKRMLAADPRLISVKGAHGLPLLYFAAIRGHEEIASFLFERGAKVNAGSGGNTALHGAVIFGQAGIVTWLLANGADPAALDYNGKTPLQLAEENKLVEISALIRHARRED